ncbi:MAG TPA: hypothetical protein VGX95_17960 [Xanthobacteraceae bacterium]|nr:hypothetical protein [Xanthobacteraceae bacterium]
MSDPDPEDPPAASPPRRALEAARRLSQLLARPLGTPAPPGEAPEPYVPRPARSAPPPAPAPAPPDDTASVTAPPPVAPADEPDLPWFDRPVQPRLPEPVAPPEPPAAHEAGAPLEAAADDEPREEARDDDLFERRDPPPLHAPPAPEHEAGPLDPPVHRRVDESVGQLAREPERIPEWAWPSSLDRAAEPAPAPRAALGPSPEPLVTPEPVRQPPHEAAAAATPLDPDAARTLGNIRRLMLFSNLFMVVAIGAVLAVVGYRIYRTEPAAAPPAPAPVVAPAPPKIPIDMTLTLPRGARILETAVAGDRLVITIEIGGATEIRTFDIKPLQPAGRLSFTTVP